MKQKDVIVEIHEDVMIVQEGSRIILEAGDRIRVLEGPNDLDAARVMQFANLILKSRNEYALIMWNKAVKEVDGAEERNLDGVDSRGLTTLFNQAVKIIKDFNLL